MDSAELDLNNANLSSSTVDSEDYDKDLRLAAELGRYLLERNQELQNYINVLQKQLDDQQCDMQLLHSKYLSTREQLNVKCKQTEMLDATNFDLEQEVAILRRENGKNHQQIKELLDICEKSRRQYQDIEQEYVAFRTKQFSSFFPSPCSTPVSTKRSRSNSFSLQSTFDSLPLNSSHLFDLASTSIFQSHLTELKSQIHSLTNECTTLNIQLDQSEQEKFDLLDRMTQLERQRRDENDSFQTELNHFRKLLDKSTSPPEHDLSLYEEVLQQNQSSNTSYEPTNYKELFARVYEKLKTTK